MCLIILSIFEKPNQNGSLLSTLTSILLELQKEKFTGRMDKMDAAKQIDGSATGIPQGDINWLDIFQQGKQL